MMEKMQANAICAYIALAIANKNLSLQDLEELIECLKEEEEDDREEDVNSLKFNLF